MSGPERRTARVPTEPNAETTAERTASVAPAGPDAKAISTLTAQLALRGYEARTLPEDAGYVVGRWGLFKHCATFDELQAFAVRVGAC